MISMPIPGIKSYLILDGYNLIHRARGGFQKGSWPVVFNFFRGLRPLVEKYDPTEVFIVLEGTPKRNLELLPEYKGNRASAPSDFARQKDVVIDILRHMPVTLAFHPDFEADDVVLNLIKGFGPDRHHVFVVSSDSDFTQLLQPELRPNGMPATNITVWNWRDKLDLEKPSFDYVKWKALRGDPTDNIPKCPKMTDKAALEVVKDANRLACLLNDAAFFEAYQRNLELVRLQDFSPDEMKGLVIDRGTADWDYVRQKFQSFDFQSMTKDESWTKYMSTFKNL